MIDCKIKAAGIREHLIMFHKHTQKETHTLQDATKPGTKGSTL